MINHIKKLVNELNNASIEYYNTGKSPMSDKEFDTKLDTLKELEEKTGIIFSNSPTQNVGAPILNQLYKIDISDKPMLSLDKCHTIEEIESFAKGQTLVASVKCDGLSVRIIYENGEIISANTRGNGEIGQDITEHIKHFINVPLNIPNTERLVVDGEAIITQNDFYDINTNGEFKNPRNLAAGTLASLDTSLCNTRHMRFILWDVIEFNQPIKRYSDVINFMKNYGFTVVPNLIVKSDFDYVNEKIFEKANELGIPIDGVVYKYDDVNFDTSRTAKFFNNAIAFKFKDEEVETKLIGIDYKTSRNGILTPVAIMEPVELEGTIVEKASLHNISVMYNTLHTPFVGQKIKVVKRNMIIPQISWAENIDSPDMKIEYPKNCPNCGKPTIINESEEGVKTLQCSNEHCTCRFINILDHFCSKKGLDIKGLSTATLEVLESQGWVKSLGDLFLLESKREEWENLDGFGIKSVQKIYDAINAAKTTTLTKYITALGIPLIGSTVAKEISNKCSGSWQKFRELVKDSKFSFDEWDGFGPEMNKALKYFDYTEADDLIEKYITIQEDKVVTTENLPFKDKIIVITGRLKLVQNREKLISIVEKNGGKVTGSVSSKTSILINNDISSDSSKNKKAKELNIPIITEEEFLNQCIIKE